LGAQLANTSDKHLNRLLQEMSNCFNDVEGIVGILHEQRVPLRSLAEEMWVLDHAEFYLEKIAMVRLKAIQEIVAKFGPDVQSFG